MDFSRMQGLFSPAKLEKIQSSFVAVFGLGGVGGYALEALARSGVGKFYLVDGDVICQSNVNRQILALSSTIGKSKVEVAARRVKEINENAQIITCYKMIRAEQSEDTKDLSLNLPILDELDAIVDATDDVSLKVALAYEAEKRGVLIISSGGTGNRLDCDSFKIEDIYKTSGCPLCRVLRHRLKILKVSALPVLYAKDGQMAKTDEAGVGKNRKENVISSCAWAPAIAGLKMAEYVIMNL